LSLLPAGDILQASDNLSRVINSYKKVIEGQVINGEVDLPVMSVVEGEFLASQLFNFESCNTKSSGWGFLLIVVK